MELTIRGVAFGPGDRSDPVPLTVTLLHELPGPDRSDYWLGELEQPFHWESDSDGSFEISHLVIAAQWENTSIYPGVSRLPVGIAYVIDPSILDDDRLDLAKIRYVATGVADDTTAGRPAPPPKSGVAGVIARAFGKRAGSE